MRINASAFWMIPLAVCFSAGGGERLNLIRPAQYFGMSDASGAVAITSNLFAVASDEDNILRLYRSDKPGQPVKQFELNEFLKVRGKSLEADLEAGARIGQRAYWIGSHGRNRIGKERANRCRFFAMDIQEIGQEASLVVVGKPYQRLLEDLIAATQFQSFDFADAARRAPKEEGALNIEGLSATPDGKLLLGFRNPIPRGNALLIPMLNPEEVIEGQHVRFGSAIQLDLGGLGIRDIEFCSDAYLIIAGSYHGGGRFQLFRWVGPGSIPEALRVDHLNDYNPEAIIFYPHLGWSEIQVLSDDGSRKDKSGHSKGTFRSFWLRSVKE